MGGKKLPAVWRLMVAISRFQDLLNSQKLGASVIIRYEGLNPSSRLSLIFSFLAMNSKPCTDTKCDGFDMGGLGKEVRRLN